MEDSDAKFGFYLWLIAQGWILIGHNQCNGIKLANIMMIYINLCLIFDILPEFEEII